MSNKVDWDALLAAATEARSRAHAPYSHFAVGAALLTESGTVHVGCNVENRTFGLSICAERNAIVSAIAGGAGAPVALAVVTETSPPAVPCGLCRETLTEFVEDLPILLSNPAGDRRHMTLRELFPHPFEWDPNES